MVAPPAAVLPPKTLDPPTAPPLPDPPAPPVSCCPFPLLPEHAEMKTVLMTRISPRILRLRIEEPFSIQMTTDYRDRIPHQLVMHSRQ
jgi:hypothetical protein